MKESNQDQLLISITQQLNEAAQLSREEYRSLLEEVESDCQDRLTALDDDSDDEE